MWLKFGSVRVYADADDQSASEMRKMIAGALLLRPGCFASIHHHLPSPSPLPPFSPSQLLLPQRGLLFPLCDAVRFPLFDITRSIAWASTTAA